MSGIEQSVFGVNVLADGAGLGRVCLQRETGVCGMTYYSCYGSKVPAIFESVCSKDYGKCKFRQSGDIIPEGKNPLLQLTSGGKS